METEWVKTFEVTRVESIFGYCPASAEIAVAITYSVALVITVKIVVQFIMLIKRKKHEIKKQSEESGKEAREEEW